MSDRDSNNKTEQRFNLEIKGTSELDIRIKTIFKNTIKYITEL